MLSSAVKAMDTAMAGSTQAGDALVQPSVASTSVMEWPMVKAVTVRSSDTHGRRPVPGVVTTRRTRTSCNGSTSASRNAMWS